MRHHVLHTTTSYTFNVGAILLGLLLLLVPTGAIVLFVASRNKGGPAEGQPSISNQNGARQDAEKKRRGYVAKTTGGLSLTYILGLCSIAAGLLTPLLFLGAMFTDNCMEDEDGAPKSQGIEKLREDYPFLVPIAFGAFALGSGLLCRFSFKKTKALPYVPPVEEQLAAIASLPAEEILLRHSDQPSTAPEELLRAARAGETGTEAGELLRADERLL